MNEKDRNRLIEILQNIENKDSIVIDKLEVLLSQLRKDHGILLNMLMRLKSKVKNDEETK